MSDRLYVHKVCSLCLLDLWLTRLLVISAITTKSCLEVLRFSLDWAVDTLKAFSASLRSDAFTRLVGIVELGTAGLGTAGLGTAGLGTAGLSTAGLGTSGLGTAGLGTAERCTTDLCTAAAAGGGLDCLEIFDICVY